MKRAKKFLAGLLATLMIVSSALTVSAGRFQDVADHYTYRDAIDVLTQLGVLGGYEDGSFKPENKIERDEMAKIIFVLSTTFGEAGTSKANFTDTNGNWAEGFIAWCTAEKIVGGHGDGTFRPDDNITYDQALKMVVAALGYTDFDSNKWPIDVRLKGIKELGLNAGLPSNLNGSEELTRGQVAQIVYNALFVDMKETKTITYTQVDVNGNRYQVPVQVNKQLASDVWSFESFVGQVVATENYALDGKTAIGDRDSVIVEGFKNNETGNATPNLDGSYEIADLGLTEYAADTDALLGREIKLFYLDGELVEKTALVYGNIDIDAVLATVKKSDGKTDDTTKISVNGKIYNINDIYCTVDANGKITKDDSTRLATGADVAYNNFPKDNDGEYIANQPLSELLLMTYSTGVHNQKKNAVHAIDSDGNGEIDYLIVLPQALYEVTGISSTKLTYKEVRGTEKVIDLDLVKKTVTLKKGDVFVASVFGKFLMVNSIVTPVERYITKNSEGAIFFANDTQSYWNGSGTLNVFYQASNNPAIGGVGKDSTTAMYYIVDRRIVLIKGIDNAANEEQLNTAILMYAEGQTSWEYNAADGKYYRYYPVILNVGGREEKVNVASIDGATALNDEPANAYGSLIMVPNAQGYAQYANVYVSYEVNDKGLYVIKTESTMAIKDATIELLLNQGYTISYVESADVYKLSNGTDSILFELDENSAVYYENEDGRIQLYTESNMPTKLKANVLTASKAYFVNADQTVKTLVSVVLADTLGSGVASTGENDPMNHKLLYAGTGLEEINGEIHYVYRYLIPATGEYVVTNSILSKDDGAVSYAGGTMISYKEDGENTVKVEANVNPSFKKETVTAVREKGSILFTNAATDGFKVGSAAIRKLNVVKSSDTSYYISGASNSSFAELMTAYNEAAEDGNTFTIYYGVDEDDNIVYILYGEYIENAIK